MTYDYSQCGGVLVARQDKILTITLNSPETLNAFTGPMHTSMSRIWDDVNDDPDVHVVVLTGAGRAFSAGGNVIAMQKKIDDPDAWEAGMPEARRIVFRIPSGKMRWWQASKLKWSRWRPVYDSGYQQHPAGHYN
jgi:enoyl-CoA hydratase